MMIIDSHLHCFPWIKGIRDGKAETRGDRLGVVRRVEKGTSTEERYLPPSFYEVSSLPEVALAYMQDAGVNKAILMQAPCYGNHNEFVSEIVGRWPDKFIGMGLVDPRRRVQTVVKEIRHIVSNLDLRGIKFEVPDTPFYPGEDKYLPMWEKINEQGVPAVVDLGWGEGEYYFQLEGIRRVLSRVQGLRIVLAHLGVSRLWDPQEEYPFPTLQKTLSLAEEFPNVMFDIAGLTNATAYMGTADEEFPFSRMQKAIQATYQRVGADRIMWGSDYPSVLLACTYKQVVKIITDHCDFLSPREKERIMGKNAQQVFGF